MPGDGKRRWKPHVWRETYHWHYAYTRRLLTGLQACLLQEVVTLGADSFLVRNESLFKEIMSGVFTNMDTFEWQMYYKGWTHKQGTSCWMWSAGENLMEWYKRRLPILDEPMPGRAKHGVKRKYESHSPCVGTAPAPDPAPTPAPMDGGQDSKRACPGREHHAPGWMADYDISVDADVDKKGGLPPPPRASEVVAGTMPGGGGGRSSSRVRRETRDWNPLYIRRLLTGLRSCLEMDAIALGPTTIVILNKPLFEKIMSSSNVFKNMYNFKRLMYYKGWKHPHGTPYWVWSAGESLTEWYKRSLPLLDDPMPLCSNYSVKSTGHDVYVDVDTGNEGGLPPPRGRDSDSVSAATEIRVGARVRPPGGSSDRVADMDMDSGDESLDSDDENESGDVSEEHDEVAVIAASPRHDLHHCETVAVAEAEMVDEAQPCLPLQSQLRPTGADAGAGAGADAGTDPGY